MSTSLSSTSTIVKLNIYVDPNCGWCYVGEKEIELAVRRLNESYPEITFDIEYKSYMLEPTLPLDRSLNLQSHYVERYGADRAKVTQEMLASRGEGVGITFKFGGVVRQSLLALRLIKRAHEIGGGQAQQVMISEICRKVFEEERDVGCISTLAQCAAASGLMCNEQAIAFLTSDQLKDEVQKEVVEARRKGITGVPFIVINDKYAVCGGQPAEVYVQALQKVVANDQP